MEFAVLECADWRSNCTVYASAAEADRIQTRDWWQTGRHRRQYEYTTLLPETRHVIVVVTRYRGRGTYKFTTRIYQCFVDDAVDEIYADMLFEAAAHVKGVEPDQHTFDRLYAAAAGSVGTDEWRLEFEKLCNEYMDNFYVFIEALVLAVRPTL